MFRGVDVMTGPSVLGKASVGDTAFTASLSDNRALSQSNWDGKGLARQVTGNRIT
jgi:hypothetical protein